MQRGLRATAALLVLLTRSASFMVPCSAPAARKLLLTSRSMSTTTAPQEVARRLVKMMEEKKKKPLVCIAIAGGGAHAIAALTATPGASSLLLEGTVTYDRSSFHSYVQRGPDSEDFKYVSSEAAQLLSKAALERALRYRPKQQSQCVGVGASSALVSKPDRLSRGHIVATHADGRQWECYIKLASNKRTRLEEDEVLSRLILESIEQVNSDDDVDPVVLLDNTSSIAEDELKQWHSPGISAEDAVRLGAERVLNGDAPAVLLLPSRRGDGGTSSFFATPQAVLPNRSIVFPGSFNPPHVGHVALANAAKSVYTATTTTKGDEDPTVFFEISMMNADKPLLEPTAVVERAQALSQLLNDDDDDSSLLPTTKWGILLTSSPLFSQKADILRDCIADFTTSRPPQMAFCIGTDTMVRILNPKYYGGSKDAMLEALRDMKGVHFCVGGRLQQVGAGDKFVTGKEELADLPRDVQDMFSLVDDFRVDISSTELRKKQEASSSSS